MQLNFWTKEITSINPVVQHCTHLHAEAWPIYGLVTSVPLKINHSSNKIFIIMNESMTFVVQTQVLLPTLSTVGIHIGKNTKFWANRGESTIWRMYLGGLITCVKLYTLYFTMYGNINLLKFFFLLSSSSWNALDILSSN